VHHKLERPTIAELARDGVIDGLKDSSGDEGNFRGVLIDNREVDGFVAFTGSERMVDAILQAGAAGCVPGIGNVDPAGFVRIYDAVRAGDLATARVEQDRLFKLFAITRQATRQEVGPTASALGGFKTALQLLGVIATNVPGRPMTRLNDEEVAGVRAILIETGLLS
jgi:4-hydroxy-tetrahydrodipicolinate synthase